MQKSTFRHELVLKMCFFGVAKVVQKIIESLRFFWFNHETYSYTQKSLFNEYRFPVMKYLCAIIFKGELKFMLQNLCKISRTTHNVKTLFLDKMLMLIKITVTVEKSFIQSYINHTNNTRLFIKKNKGFKGT